MATTRAITSNGGKLSKKADSALERFRIVVEGSDAAHVKYVSAVTDRPVGITADGADAAEDEISIQTFNRGETKIVKLNGTCAKGDWLTAEDPGTDAYGKARKVPATAGAFWVIGRALEAGADEQEIAFEDCLPFLAGAQHANGQLSVPSFATDPTTPSANQLWVNSADNSLNVWVNGAKRTIAFISAVLGFSLLAGLLLSQPAMAGDVTPMVLGSATTGAIAAATGSDNVKVPGTLEVVGSVTAAGFVGKVSRTFAFSDMTDNLNTTGYIDIATQIPAGSVVLGWKAVTTTGFTGDTTATIQVGIAGGVGNFSTTTNGSVAAAGTVGSASVLATSFCAAATTARVTITGGADFTSISAGSTTVTVFYAY